MTTAMLTLMRASAVPPSLGQLASRGGLELGRNALQDCFDRRLASWGLVPPSAARWSEVRTFMVALPPSWAWALLRTWAGGWTTTARFSSSVRRGCLFGCTGQADAMAHYLVCPVVWTLSSSYLRTAAPEDVLGRLGLPAGELTEEGVQHAVFANFLYHKVKRVGSQLHGAAKAALYLLRSGRPLRGGRVARLLERA